MNALDIFTGSNGKATLRFYSALQAVGPAGVIAMNLFRACKASTRAKMYSRRYRGDAYAKKEWSIGLLCNALEQHAVTFGITWGWKEDPAAVYYKWVLYVDTPKGQASYHLMSRGIGPHYTGEWDQTQNSAVHITNWCDSLLASKAVEAGENPEI